MTKHMAEIILTDLQVRARVLAGGRAGVSRT